MRPLCFLRLEGAMTERRFERALITGITGSGGSYLAEYLVDHVPDLAVHGVARWHSTSAARNLQRTGERVAVHECDLADLSSVIHVLREVRPDVIFHLASHANVRASFITPLSVIQNNVMGTASLLEGIRLAEIDPVVQLCSTSEVYGQVHPDEVPIRESQPMRPSSPYAVSKVTQDLLGLTYFRAYGLKIIRTRMFAYVNPRRADLFASAFARQVARIELGLQDELRHGNLESVRTLIDVRDAMEAYWLAVLHCEPGEDYNIGGATTISVGDFLALLKEHAKVPIPSSVDPDLLRPADVTLQIPDVSKFEKATGWKPRHSVDDSVDILLAYWRERANAEA
jgi:GDPmannose 4,6-dehydratase/GDP-4-dehydro-6-deoxy-D-mannose reductase